MHRIDAQNHEEKQTPNPTKSLQKFKWSENISKIFQSSLQLPKIKQKLNHSINNEFLDDQNGIDDICDHLTTAIKDAASLCTKLVKKKGYRKHCGRKKNQLGFDHNCKQLKERTLNL